MTGLPTSTLVDACRAAPDDDGPRLVLADALGGERGEFIVVQCALARGGQSPADSGALRRRQRELAAAHGVAWAGLTGLAKTVTYRRGFVDAAMIDARVLAERADEIFAAAPLLRHVALADLSTVGPPSGADPLPSLRAALARLPAIAGLHVDNVGHLVETGRTDPAYDFVSLDGPAFEIILGSGAIGRVRSLSLPTLASEIATALIASGQLAGIERFASSLEPAAGLALAAHMPALRALDLRLGRGWPAALPQVAELRVARRDDAAIAALAASPVAATLERLSLDEDRIANAIPMLARLPRLRALELAPSRGDRAHRDLAPALAALQIPTLRELHCVELAADGAFAIARALGPQLELLDLRGCAAELDARHDELQHLVAGDVLTGAWQRPHRLAFLGREPREPLWDMPLVELPRIPLAR